MKNFKSILTWKAKNVYLKSISFRNRHPSFSYPIDSNIVIFGSGRSGTTWIAEVLNQIEGSTLLNEPLKNSNSKRIQKLGLTGWGQYIPENDTEWKEAHRFFTQLFSGQVYNPNHIHPKNSYRAIPKTTWWIHKFIRANLLMPWILNNFVIRPPLFIIRNPYAVVNSQLKHVGWGKGRRKDFPNGITLPHFEHFPEYYEKYAEAFAKVRRMEQQLTLRWIMENEYILSHPYHNHKWLTLSYELLVMHPKRELGRIFSNLDIHPPDDLFEHIRKMSNSSFSKGEIKNPQKQLNKWQSELNTEQKELIQETLSFTPFESIFPLNSDLKNLETLYNPSVLKHTQ